MSHLKYKWKFFLRLGRVFFHFRIFVHILSICFYCQSIRLKLKNFSQMALIRLKNFIRKKIMWCSFKIANNFWLQRCQIFNVNIWRFTFDNFNYNLLIEPSIVKRRRFICTSMYISKVIRFLPRRHHLEDNFLTWNMNGSWSKKNCFFHFPAKGIHNIKIKLTQTLLTFFRMSLMKSQLLSKPSRRDRW